MKRNAVDIANTGWPEIMSECQGWWLCYCSILRGFSFSVRQYYLAHALYLSFVRPVEILLKNFSAANINVVIKGKSDDAKTKKKYSHHSLLCVSSVQRKMMHN